MLGYVSIGCGKSYYKLCVEILPGRKRRKDAVEEEGLSQQLMQFTINSYEQDCASS